jgi:methionyl-tRNA synthetase
LKEWVVKTPCPKCKDLSDDYRKCTNCGAEIFPFTIVDPRYSLKTLLEQLGFEYKGRF